MLCGGNASEYCGGPDRLDMYQLNGSLPAPTSTTSTPAMSPTPTPGAPSVVPSAGGYGYIGCYTDSTANRALTGLANPVAGATLTVELCAAACVGFTYFGVEYSAVRIFEIMFCFKYRCWSQDMIRNRILTQKSSIGMLLRKRITRRFRPGYWWKRPNAEFVRYDVRWQY